MSDEALTSPPGQSQPAPNQHGRGEHRANEHRANEHRQGERRQIQDVQDQYAASRARHAADTFVFSREDFEKEDRIFVTASHRQFVDTLLMKGANENELPRESLAISAWQRLQDELYDSNFHGFLLDAKWAFGMADAFDLIRLAISMNRREDVREPFETVVSIYEAVGVDGIAALQPIYENKDPHAVAIESLRSAIWSSEPDETQTLGFWLCNHPKRLILDEADISTEITRRVALIPDLDERKRERFERAPRYIQLAESLCRKSGLNFAVIASIWDDQQDDDGRSISVINILADGKPFEILDYSTHATMQYGSKPDEVVRIDGTPEWIDPKK